MTMHWYALPLITCIQSWLHAPLEQPHACTVQSSPVPSQTQIAVPTQKPSLPDRQLILQNLARLITVKVMAGKNSGSGILVQHQGANYSVVTNQHVLNPGKPYRIQAPDGRIYLADLLPGRYFRRGNRFLGNDLEVLQFRSWQRYAIAPLNPTAPLTVGDDIYAAGFPHEPEPGINRGFVFTTGQVSLLPAQPLVGGYQIGYTNSIRQGMSGGPLLNRQGEVVGVNGLHAYPLWGNPYTFQDGTQPTPAARPAIARSSWAIPIATFICLTPLTQMSFSAPAKRAEVCKKG